ncbi:hypothetical protein AAEO50_13740 [Rossellomorea oryzaecorticis]|uniref:Uncharacterized protein n=1 Tax=Rossellomorea oryzaecorticis TaxID=1396505 RepID=A0ABU9KB65_9BACI
MKFIIEIERFIIENDNFIIEITKTTFLYYRAAGDFIELVTLLPGSASYYRNWLGIIEPPPSPSISQNTLDIINPPRPPLENSNT